MPADTPPTVEQLFILVDRAERKGGLSRAEGARLRTGLRYLADEPLTIADLRRRNGNLRVALGYWKQRAAAPGKTPGPTPTPAPAAAPVDEAARDALRRVTALARRWTHIPAKRQAGASVLAAITNRDPE
ncbi:hypothetical protein [Streptomyces europaeiscabiei]|uniref:hypothetical protein n=1 Tax=Streptomyces europaeiscabiei TaxID=146819 RepID=UPI0029A02BE8|nr:hypothetical protein [Streptomyces europaeiscabiei]MDX3672765.1 hypothetical protein [Streptomyces europaeiscabiei]